MPYITKDAKVRAQSVSVGDIKCQPPEYRVNQTVYADLGSGRGGPYVWYESMTAQRRPRTCWRRKADRKLTEGVRLTSSVSAASLESGIEEQEWYGVHVRVR